MKAAVLKTKSDKLVFLPQQHQAISKVARASFEASHQVAVTLDAGLTGL